MTAPVIPGFHPDPTICRADDRYFLATSSFEYFPGVPIFASDDLISWEQVGNALDRPSQLQVHVGIEGSSGGVYAPSLRYHDCQFWLTTTNVHDMASGHLIVTAQDPAGPWSDPVYTRGLIGVDPDLAWEDDGTCRITWSDVLGGGISQAVIDPATGDVRSEPVEIWRGTGGAHAEGPHVFRRGAWWYLLVAEGGTAAGHMVTIARSSAVDGPYEAYPGNPILSHRSTSLPVQATGHGDMVECVDGTWVMVYLGTRPRGSFPRWHTNGRETFLAHVGWENDWPVVHEHDSDIARDGSFDDDFREPRLHPRWISPGADPKSFAVPGPSGLALAKGRSAEDTEASRLLAARITDDEWTATMYCSGEAALVLRVDDQHQAMVERTSAGIRARVVIGPADQVMGSVNGVSRDAPLAIRAEPFAGPRGRRQGPDRVVLGYGDPFVPVATIDGRYLSTEVAGGFTGRVIGVEALASGVHVTRFRYDAH